MQGDCFVYAWSCRTLGMRLISLRGEGTFCFFVGMDGGPLDGFCSVRARSLNLVGTACRMSRFWCPRACVFRKPTRAVTCLVLLLLAPSRQAEGVPIVIPG